MALILTKLFIASILNKIHQGLKYVEEGHLITTEELMREIGSFPR